MKLIKQGWVTYPMYRGNKFIIENPDDTDERYTFSSNNQILWFLRGFESGLKKTEETVEEAEVTEEHDVAQQQLNLEEGSVETT